MNRQNETMVPLTKGVLHAPVGTPERIRVLFVLGSMAGGGAERIVAHLVKHLNRDEFDARIGLLWQHGDYLDQLTDDEFIVTRLAHGWIPYRDQPPWWQLLPSLALVPLQQRDLVRRFRPHIVVTATKSMNIAGRFSLALAGRSALRWVAREGNNTGAMIDNESATGFLRALQNFAVRTAYRRADRVVAISDGVSRALSRRFGIDPKRVSTIYNAVDVATVKVRAQEALPNLSREPFLVAAGRLVPQKGFDILIRAFAATLAVRPLSLVILGDGPERNALIELTRACGIEHRVHFPGFVENPWSYFARSAAFVCSSRWEGFGNVIIEAMACGVPVVATDCDFGPREVIRQGQSGLLVPVDDVDSLGKAIASVLDNPDLARELAGGALQRAQEFDVANMARAYEALFRELTNGTP
jgi:glycosyltransferase involved in cell wall biosynthesis